MLRSPPCVVSGNHEPDNALASCTIKSDVLTSATLMADLVKCEEVNWLLDWEESMVAGHDDWVGIRPAFSCECSSSRHGTSL